MITWEYRVFREPNGDHIIREVFYDDKGNVLGCTQNAVEPMGKSLQALGAELRSFQAALKLPVLTLADMPPASGKKIKRDRSKNRTLEQVTAELNLGVRTKKNGHTAQSTTTKRTLSAASKKK